MVVKVYKDYDDFRNRHESERDFNGVTQDWLDEKKITIDRVFLVDCKGCFNCNKLYNCYDCVNSRNLYYCVDCEDCYDSANCINCAECSECSGCFNCVDCELCTNCRFSSGLNTAVQVIYC